MDGSYRSGRRRTFAGKAALQDRPCSRVGADGKHQAGRAAADCRAYDTGSRICCRIIGRRIIDRRIIGRDFCRDEPLRARLVRARQRPLERRLAHGKRHLVFHPAAFVQKPLCSCTSRARIRRVFRFRAFLRYNFNRFQHRHLHLVQHQTGRIRNYRLLEPSRCAFLVDIPRNRISFVRRRSRYPCRRQVSFRYRFRKYQPFSERTGVVLRPDTIQLENRQVQIFQHGRNLCLASERGRICCAEYEHAMDR
ncbi:MAG: hypothetical protein BWY39_01660 [Spirochaetes bacterium ADurb.Bin269]|nr:MAG: hypothetical protein BWY39_01660 [Spirochaetes bacterium ADurb.Bin269]